MYTNNGSQGSGRRIRRAAAACYRCHWRKVRCDAAVLGYPCTNCTLDGVTDCILRPNGTSRFKSLQKHDTGNLSPKPTAPDGSQPVVSCTSSQYDPTISVADTALQNPGVPEMELSLGFDMGLSVPEPDLHNVDPAPWMVGNASPIFPGQNFFDLDRLSSLPMNDVHVLMVNGCLEIPPRSAVDMLLKKYFLLLHPSIPVVDEARFWNSYVQSNANLDPVQRVSLFVFQAMLLASCAFVPVEIIQQCGFPDICVARRALYHRAKVLYDTSFECDPVARAQGALLLTFHTTAEDPQAAMTWNLCAIRNTMAVGFDLDAPDSDANKIAKKRLWWSVFVRDRILWLGRHRRPQFISANFNMPVGYLEEHDFVDEITSSPVYASEAKCLVLRIFRAQCRLAIILTDVISIAFLGVDGYPPRLSAKGFHTSLAQIGMLKGRLARWRQELQVPLYKTDIPQQEAVDILTNLTLMHYQSARMALAHHENFLVEHHLELIQDRSAAMLLGIAKELKDCMSHITQNMAYFASKNLTENIPLSVLASCGTPMILSAVDVKLSSSYSEMLERRRAVDDCSEVVKQSGKVYDVTEFFSHGTNNILQLAYAITKNLFLGDNPIQQRNEMPNVPHPSHPDSDNTYSGNGDGQPRNTVAPAFNGLRIKGWFEAFLKYPRAYLALSTCIDHSLATGRLPQDELLPPLIRGTVSVILGFPKLPWTITAPINPSHAANAEKKSIEDRRRLQEGESGSSTSSAMSLVERHKPSLDDTWYWTLMHNAPGGSQSMGPMADCIEGESPRKTNETANMTSSNDEPEIGYYPNPSLGLDLHLFGPFSGET